MFTDQQARAIRQLFSEKKKIVLTTHTNPDGDAIGATLGMLHYLRKKGHDVQAVVPNKFPSFYGWLPGSEELIIFEQEAKKARVALESAEIVFSLDYNTTSRVGQLADDLKKVSAVKIMIDHHPDPESGYDYYFHTVETSSTGELVYDFMEINGDLSLLDKKIAAALYVSIMTDTGSFSFASNYAKTYRVVANLIETGIDAELIHRMVYDTFTENRLRLLGFSITEKMLVWHDLHTAVIYLTKNDLNRFGYQVGDTEGIVNFPLSMEDVNLSVLITEKDKKIRLSFRSKGDFAVNEVAKNHFEGGGHRNAAGGYSYVSMDETLKKLKAVLQNYQTALNYKIKYQ